MYLFVLAYIFPLSDRFQKFDHKISVQLFEYDKRFEQYGSDFIFYDYHQPEELPSELKHAYGIVVADPPYLVSVFVYGTEYLITGPLPLWSCYCLVYCYRVPIL